MDKERAQIDKATELLAKAQHAVNQGDVVTMLRALGASGYLDGLKHRLQKKWGGSLPWTEIDECIAQSVDAACAAVTRECVIRNLGAWLWKSADNIANDRWRFDYGKRVDFDDNTLSAVLDENEMELDREKRQELEETHRREAIQIARMLLPQIGGGQVRDVMELVIDAAENRLPDLPASSIADALGISSSAARALVSRGMKRLHRLAKQEGIGALAVLPDTEAEEEEQNDE